MIPFLDSGFPDMVIVEYDTRVFEHWPHSRFLLRPIDLKVLHHLHHVKRANTDSIKTLLGMNGGDLLKTLELLVDAGLIIESIHERYPVSLDPVFGIKRLVAVEVKMKNLAAALHQAVANKWFASETYIVSPVQGVSASKPENCTLRFGCADPTKGRPFKFGGVSQHPNLNGLHSGRCRRCVSG